MALPGRSDCRHRRRLRGTHPHSYVLGVQRVETGEECSFGAGALARVSERSSPLRSASAHPPTLPLGGRHPEGLQARGISRVPPHICRCPRDPSGLKPPWVTPSIGGNVLRGKGASSSVVKSARGAGRCANRSTLSIMKAHAKVSETHTAGAGRLRSLLRPRS